MVSGQANTRRSAAEPGSSCSCESGGGFEGDPVAQRFELADVVAFLAVLAQASVVEVRAQVLEMDIRVGQHVPDDDQDRAADRDKGFRSVNTNSWPGPTPAARRPRRSRSRDSCWAYHGPASSTISLSSRRRGMPV